jgi:hypothetical protein
MLYLIDHHNLHHRAWCRRDEQSRYRQNKKGKHQWTLEQQKESRRMSA